MGKPYSVDLRERALALIDAGDTASEVAEFFQVTVRTLRSWLALRRQTGEVAPRKGVVGPKPKLAEHRAKITAAVQAAPSATLEELRVTLSLPGCLSTLWNALEQWGLTLKKCDVRGGAEATRCAVAADVVGHSRAGEIPPFAACFPR